MSYFELLHTEAMKSGCMLRKYAALVEKNGEVVGLGHATVPNGMPCEELGFCTRELAQKEVDNNAECFEHCRVVHAEVCAILQAERNLLPGATLHLLGICSENRQIYSGAFPCALCLNIIEYVGISRICVFSARNELTTFIFKEGVWNAL